VALVVGQRLAARTHSRNCLRSVARTATVRAVDPADAVLSARLVAGDDDALAEVFDSYAAVVLAAARRVVGSGSAAEDVMQDVFVTLWQRPDRYDAHRGSLRTYLTTLAHHRGVDIVRSELRRMGRERLSVRLIPEQRSGDEADAQIVAEVVRDAVNLLPCEQRQVVELAYFKGLTYRDVAATAGIPEGTAKSRLRLALAKLEAALDPELLEAT
jgi:RNA polymerase sigma-70 factor (ECF subfamily)